MYVCADVFLSNVLLYFIDACVSCRFIFRDIHNEKGVKLVQRPKIFGKTRMYRPNLRLSIFRQTALYVKLPFSEAHTPEPGPSMEHTHHRFQPHPLIVNNVT